MGSFCQIQSQRAVGDWRSPQNCRGRTGFINNRLENRELMRGQGNGWARLRLFPREPQPEHSRLPPSALIVLLPQMKIIRLVIELTNLAISLVLPNVAFRTGGIRALSVRDFRVCGSRVGNHPSQNGKRVVIVTSWHTRDHLVISLVSGVTWFLAALMLVFPMRRSPDWHGWHIINIAFVPLGLVGGIRSQSSTSGWARPANC
jgi:hypothetical protein